MVLAVQLTYAQTALRCCQPSGLVKPIHTPWKRVRLFWSRCELGCRACSQEQHRRVFVQGKTPKVSACHLPGMLPLSIQASPAQRTVTNSRALTV
jgi:hypothetical protein